MGGFSLIIKQDEEEPDIAEVLVDGTIGGTEYRFLLDTGAAKTSVARDDYTSTFASSGISSSSGVFADIREDLIVVPSVTVGTVSKTDFTVARSTAQGKDARGLIGMDFLKDHCCCFLFDEERVSVDPDNDPETVSGYQELSLDRVSHPYVEVRFGEVKAQTVWDTGAGITIADTNFIEKHPALFQEIASSHGTDASGSQKETPLFIMATTVIGDHPFPPTKVAGVDLSRVNATLEMPMDLILGYPLLSRANWVFDLPRKKWAILKLLAS